MPTVFYQSGAISMTIQYLWDKGNGSALLYRRRYPKAIVEYYASKGEHLPTYRTVSLKTKDIAEAAKRIAKLAREDEQEWDRLLTGYKGISSLEAAKSLLRRHGIPIPDPTHKTPKEDITHQLTETELNALVAEADTHPEPLDLWIDQLAGKVPEQGHINEHLLPAERDALALANGRYKFKLSDAREYALKLKQDNRKACNKVSRAFEVFIGHLGDRAIADYRRKEVNELIRSLVAKGEVKTVTIKKYLCEVRSALKAFLTENEAEDLIQPFKEVTIPKLGQDSEKGKSVTPAELNHLRQLARDKAKADNTTHNILGMLIDTGARLGEIAGLKVSDVSLDTPIPYITIQASKERSLKNPQSQRTLPLVGDALASARHAVDAADNSPYLFPRYIRDGQYGNDKAAAAINNELKKAGAVTTRSLRHTMRDRLRNADVPKPEVDEIHGWTRDNMSDYYGSGTALATLHSHLLKSLDWHGSYTEPEAL